MKGQGGDAPGLHIAAGALPQALRGGKHFVPSLATADQLRRRMGVPEPDGAHDQRLALDRIARRSATGENPLLQFVARNTVSSYATMPGSTPYFEIVMGPTKRIRTPWLAGCG